MVRPWNAPAKLRMQSSGAPGPELIMELSISSCVKSVAPKPRAARSRPRYAMKMLLNAFSLADDPHSMVCTQSMPAGAMDLQIQAYCEALVL